MYESLERDYIIHGHKTARNPHAEAKNPGPFQMIFLFNSIPQDMVVDRILYTDAARMQFLTGSEVFIPAGTYTEKRTGPVVGQKNAGMNMQLARGRINMVLDGARLNEGL